MNTQIAPSNTQIWIVNTGTEAINAKILAVKRRACGFCSRQRFRTATFFQCGGLDLYPAAVRASS